MSFLEVYKELMNFFIVFPFFLSFILIKNLNSYIKNRYYIFKENS